MKPAGLVHKLCYMLFFSTMARIFVFEEFLSIRICGFHKSLARLPRLQYTPTWNFGSKNHSGGVNSHSEGKVVSIV